jgi:hypothetical protein
MDEAAFGLKARHIGVEIHPVDAFHFQGHVMADYFSDVVRYHDCGLRWLYFDLKGPIAQRSNAGLGNTTTSGNGGAHPPSNHASSV